MRTYSHDELRAILDLHKKWLFHEEGGKRADFTGNNLVSKNLSHADLSYAIGVFAETYEGACRVTGVVPGSAADVAGLQIGDVITAVDGEAVGDFPGLVQVVRKRRVGDKGSVDFKRDGKNHRVEAVLERLKE